MTEGGGKNYYTIAEAARLKGVSVEEVLYKIRNGELSTQRIGMRDMVPASGLLQEETTGPDNHVEEYMKKVLPELYKALNDAPEYGSCGLVITFHGRKIAKVNYHKETTLPLEDNQKVEGDKI